MPTPLLAEPEDDALDDSGLDDGVLDDYLGLLHRPLRKFRLIVFHGESGSGKSSLMRLVATRHSDFAGRQRSWIQPFDPIPAHAEVLLVDEVQGWRDLHCLTPALRTAQAVLLASHVDPRWLWPWRFRHASLCLRLDRVTIKLERQLARLGVRYSARALDTFMARFGANFTDLEIVLELGPGDDLDAAMALLDRGSGIERGALRPR